MSIDKPILAMVRDQFERKMRGQVQALVNKVIEETFDQINKNLMVEFRPAGDGTFSLVFTWKELHDQT